MAEKDLQQIVERAVAQVLDRQLRNLQAELVERVLAELPSIEAPVSSEDTGSATPANLVQSVAAIHAGTTQKEILRALLDAASAYGARIALFVVKAGTATGWQARGFGEDEAVKDFALDMTSGPVAHAYQNRVATPANIAEMDQGFVQRFGGPDNEQVLVLPLVLKDKVAALLYADGGADGLLDAAALELMVMATSAWLEVTSLRKQAHKDGGDGAAMERPAVQSVSSFADPFAAHAPKHTAPEPEPVAEVVEVGAHAAAASAAASAPAAATDPFAAMSAEDADTHRKAQRFARLLVDEIKLYNQAKVAEGRRNRDLYDRLKDDIEKSRATYQKRYGHTAAAAGDYFQKEVVRSLAEDDLSVMGAGFKK
ncbi:MAG TPA: GAF domain-containing protein [Verrucomicrobiae bacterium]|nr:GAF domain-containing protein [Verrucomicrobiae bacterium]